MRRPTLLLLALPLLTGYVSSVSAGESKITRTSQMWGTETAEGKVSATVGIAGECVESGADMVCFFVSLALSSGAKCMAVASTWTEVFKRVARTKDDVRWGSTKGPTGLSGVLTTTVLVAKRSSVANSERDFFNDPAYGPGARDQWSYHSTQTFTAPLMTGQQTPPVTTSLSTGALPAERFCKPTNALLMAISPDY